MRIPSFETLILKLVLILKVRHRVQEDMRNQWGVSKRNLFETTLQVICTSRSRDRKPRAVLE
jgi:hypothetical protein